MIRCFSIVLFLISTILCGCKQKQNGNAALPQIADFIIDSIYLPLSEGNHQKLKIKEVKDANADQLIAFVKESNFKLYTYDITTSGYVDSIDISKYRNNYIDFAPINKDSFIVSLNTNQIALISKQRTQTWNVDFIKKMLGSNACIGYNSAEPLHAFGDTVMVTTASTENFPIETGPNILFLKANCDLIFRLRQDSVQFIAMHNPNPEYLFQQDYNTASERAYINNHRIINTFKHSDTITIFDFKTGKEEKKKYITQNFFKNQPFDYSKIGDFGYLKKYAIEQSRSGLGDLYYDSHKHLIYQTLHHKGQYIDSVTGAKNKTEDIPSSIFVFDENLNQLKEVYVPGKTLTYSQFSFITKSGFYYAQAFSKQKYHDKMLFYRIVFN